MSLPSGDALAIAAATFAVLGFDGLRFSSFVAGRDDVALRADLVWLGAAIAGTVTIVSRDTLTAQNLAWCYGGAAVIGSVLFLPVIRTLRFFPVPSGLTKEFKFGADFVLQIVPGQVALAVAAIATSLDAVGALRAAVTLFSPLATVIYAVRLIVIDRTSRGWSASPGLVYGSTAALYGSALTLVFAVFSGTTERVFGPLSTTVLLLVAAGEVSRHMTQAVVDQARSRRIAETCDIGSGRSGGSPDQRNPRLRSSTGCQRIGTCTGHGVQPTSRVQPETDLELPRSSQRSCEVTDPSMTSHEVESTLLQNGSNLGPGSLVCFDDQSPYSTQS